MRVLVATILPRDAAAVWTRMQTSACMVEVSAPFITFQPTKPSSFPERWQQRETYEMTMRFGGFIPLGWHRITVARVDEQTHEIENHDAGPMIRTWRHVLSVQPVGPGQCKYQDAIEINAGLATPVFFLFLQAYYRFRHRRWKQWSRQ